MPMAISIMARRPWMSESLPKSGVAAVAHRRLAVTTHDMLSMSPRLAAMVGSAGRDHHLVERRQQHGEEHADDDAARGGVVEIVRRGRERSRMVSPRAGPGGEARRI